MALFGWTESISNGKWVSCFSKENSIVLFGWKIWEEMKSGNERERMAGRKEKGKWRLGWKIWQSFLLKKWKNFHLWNIIFHPLQTKGKLENHFLRKMFSAQPKHSLCYSDLSACVWHIYVPMDPTWKFYEYLLILAQFEVQSVRVHIHVGVLRTWHEYVRWNEESK